jgi:hypothetical protein
MGLISLGVSQWKKLLIKNTMKGMTIGLINIQEFISHGLLEKLK